MSSSDNETNNNQNLIEKELDRLDKFVKDAPGNEYTIDQKEQELCRNFSGGQEQCIKLHLECKLSIKCICICVCVCVCVCI